MSDEQILQGFCSYNSKIITRYYYGYCRKAYQIFDKKYNLKDKTGLDFFSLAHDYFLYLMKYNFKPLQDKPKDVKLSSWMIRGFHFVVLDAIKAYNKEFEHQSEESSDVVLDYIRASCQEDPMLLSVSQVVASHYHDKTMADIANMIIYEGYKQNEVASRLGITPSAVNQRYKKMMDEVVTPFVIECYGDGLSVGSAVPCGKILPQPLGEAFSLFSEMSSSSARHACSDSIAENRTTPSFIDSLKPDDIFVFGSNLQGLHLGGEAGLACQKFGAVMGNGIGIQGQSYAIPTMQGGVDTIKPYVDDFIRYAECHPQQHFLVAEIGCSIAGFEPCDIAPLFSKTVKINNISLPRRFWDCLI